MQEGQKTLIFLGISIVAAVVAWATYPAPPVVDVVEEVGEPLFAFDDPADASSLKIVRYAEDLGEIYDFEVSKDSQTGAWTIPSHFDYPADAEEQMRDAATVLIGIEALDVATQDASEHALYGVVEPDADSVRQGDQGVGIKVEVQDDKGQDLVSMIIGKPVKGAENQRFVRRPGQDVVYVAEIDPSKLSTTFEDWIEEDLLDINPLDVESLKLRDYSVVQTLQGGALEKRSEIDADWNAGENKWDLAKMVTYQGRDPVPTDLLTGEQLDTAKLNQLKNSLEDLKIVDVRRKPVGLGADLQADEAFLDNPENRRSLISRGFYASPTAAGEYELYAANGEVHVGMKDGYEYVLRFGNIASTDDGVEEGKLNRYLFVTARVDDTQFPLPELEEVPEAESSDAAPAPPGAEDAAADASDDEPDSAESTTDASADEKKRKLDAERERIKKENERKMNEWKEKKKTAENKVRELNARFADWYYVISEDVYKDVHLSRSDVLTESEEAQEEGFGVDAFRNLEQQGLPQTQN